MPFYKRKAFVITVAALALLVIVNLVLYEPDIPLNELKAKYANRCITVLKEPALT
jgi:hypothetical protein